MDLPVEQFKAASKAASRGDAPRGAPPETEFSGRDRTRKTGLPEAPALGSSNVVAVTTLPNSLWACITAVEKSPISPLSPHQSGRRPAVGDEVHRRQVHFAIMRSAIICAGARRDGRSRSKRSTETIVAANLSGMQLHYCCSLDRNVVVVI